MDRGNGTATLAGVPRTGGTFPVIVTAHSGVLPDATQTFTLTVIGLTSITITPAQAVLPAGADLQFTATGRYADGSTRNLTTTAHWSSSDTSFATISNQGLATGVAKGMARISATIAGVTGANTLRVTAPALVSITITPSNPTVPVGTQLQFTATGSFSDGSTGNLSRKVTWSSWAPAVAIIVPGGTAQARSAGTTTITATLNAVTGTTSLTASP